MCNYNIFSHISLNISLILIHQFRHVIIELFTEGDRYKINIIVELPKSACRKDNGIYMSIDLGINNLITCYVSTGEMLIIS